MVQNASCLGAVDGACGSLFGGAGVGHRHWDYFASFDGLFQRKKEEINNGLFSLPADSLPAFCFLFFPKKKEVSCFCVMMKKRFPVFGFPAKKEPFFDGISKPLPAGKVENEA